MNTEIAKAAKQANDRYAQDWYPIVGLDFVDANGERVTSVQLCKRSNGQAYASVTFRNGKRSEMRATAEVDVGRFLADCARLLQNSIPVVFNKQKLS